MYYGPSILIAAGVKVNGLDEEESALLLNIPLAVVNMIGTLISCFVIDRFGRRYIILRTMPGAFVGWMTVSGGMLLTLSPYTAEIGSYVSFTGILIFLLFYATGMSSTPWTINAEIYPLHVIGTANSLSTTTNWVSNFVVASIFLLALQTDTGKVISFLVLAFMAVGTWVFVYFLVPETAKKSIDEILRDILGENYQKDHSKVVETPDDSNIEETRE